MTMGKAKEALPRQKSPSPAAVSMLRTTRKGEREEENKVSTAPPSSLFPSQTSLFPPQIPLFEDFLL